MVKKTLPIAVVIYLGYLLVFLFDNTTSYLVYAKNKLHIRNMNNNLEKKQSYL